MPDFFSRNFSQKHFATQAIFVGQTHDSLPHLEVKFEKKFSRCKLNKFHSKNYTCAFKLHQRRASKKHGEDVTYNFGSTKSSIPLKFRKYTKERCYKYEMLNDHASFGHCFGHCASFFSYSFSTNIILITVTIDMSPTIQFILLNVV